MLSPLLAAAALIAPSPLIATAALSHDTRGRPVIQTRLNDRGPFPMVLDTAAQTSLIVPSVAAELALAPAPGAIGVEGATGGEAGRLYPVRRFASGLFDRRDVTLISLPNVGSTDARGIVGIDLFEGRKLIVDRVGKQVRVAPSGPAQAGFATLRGRIDDNGFLVVPLVLNNVSVDAVVDSGAAVTVANGATLRALGWAADDPRLKAGGEIRGAAAGGQTVRIATIERLKLGPATLSNVPLIIPDADDGSTAPSILLGSDLLNLLATYGLDLARAELQIAVPE